MSLILNIETATKNCSVALALEGKLIGLKESSDDNFQHNEKLLVFIKETLLESGFNYSDLKALAVSEGPGSYTGLRIGVSAAKGLCFALDIPLISINTLQSIAAQSTLKTDFISPMIDARRMEVYSAVYSPTLECLEETTALIIEKDFRKNFLDKGSVTFIGDGAEKSKAIFNHPNAHYDHSIEASAKGMILLSYTKFIAEEFENTAYFEPYYLKDFIAGKPKPLLNR